MVNVLKKFGKRILRSPVFDFLMVPFVFISALVLKAVRSIGINQMPVCRRVLLDVGIMPIRDHYYEPLFNNKHLLKPLSADRELPGITWNVEEQLSILNNFRYNDEFQTLGNQYKDDLTFYFGNNAFESGDAEYWYNIIRLKKPRRIIEIGSGNSTRLARLAIDRNKREMPGYDCEHICVEPYEKPWLEKLGSKIIRERVEKLEKSLFQSLGGDDILFIDSSHMIRPQGDVLFEYLEVLPMLNRGVIVHIHDIFSPKDYPDDWIVKQIKLWNEQYLLEAFLTCNKDWKIIGALNFLHNHHYEKLKDKCPRLTPERKPGSFYMQKLV